MALNTRAYVDAMTEGHKFKSEGYHNSNVVRIVDSPLELTDGSRTVNVPVGAEVVVFRRYAADNMTLATVFPPLSQRKQLYSVMGDGKLKIIDCAKPHSFGRRHSPRLSTRE